MPAPIGARSQEVVRGFGVALRGDFTQNSHFRLCCPAKSSPNSPGGVLPSEAAMPSNAAKIIEPLARKGNYAVRPLALAGREPGTGAYIDTEGPRIENTPERARGTNGWAVICP